MWGLLKIDGNDTPFLGKLAFSLPENNYLGVSECGFGVSSSNLSIAPNWCQHGSGLSSIWQLLGNLRGEGDQHRIPGLEHPERGVRQRARSGSPAVSGRCQW